MSTPYNVVSLSSTAVTTAPTKIAQTNGKQVVSIAVTRCPTGAEAYLRIGAPTADRLLIAVNRSLTIDVPERDGIYFENLVNVAGGIELVIGYAQPCGPPHGGITVEN